MRFWDSSALFPLLVSESSTQEVERLLEDDPKVVVWWGTRVELYSALARENRSGAVDETKLLRIRTSLDYLIEGSLRIDPRAELQGAAIELLFQHPLRAADALQLAAALTWTDGKPASPGFVCLDLRLRAAAEAVGFSVLPAEV